MEKVFDLIFFDAECGLCQRSVRFIQSIDKKKRFAFAPLQGTTAQKKLSGRLEKLKRENTMVLLENCGSTKQRVWIRGRAVFRILWLVGGAWRFAGWLYILPFGLDAVYSLIARFRHLFF
jgi:predicted DCC family thiol-disulfide oxidoreductase YuxK